MIFCKQVDWYFNYYVINWTHLSFWCLIIILLRSAAEIITIQFTTTLYYGKSAIRWLGHIEDGLIDDQGSPDPISRSKVGDVPVEWTVYRLSVIGLQIFRANNTINLKRISGNELKLHVKHKFCKQCIMTKNTGTLTLVHVSK